VELIGLYLIGCTLLALAGAMKALRPDDTARALVTLVPARWRRLVQFPQLRRLIRIVSLFEAGVGLVAVGLPRPVTAALVATSYFLFAGVVAYARSRGGALASCGCFGTPDTPATWLHAAVDLVLAGAAAAVAAAAPTRGSVFTVLAHEPLHGAPLLFLTGVAAWLTYLTMSVLAALGATRLARRRP
jgi:hypothetical protein